MACNKNANRKDYSILSDVHIFSIILRGILQSKFELAGLSLCELPPQMSFDSSSAQNELIACCLLLSRRAGEVVMKKKTVQQKATLSLQTRQERNADRKLLIV